MEEEAKERRRGGEEEEKGQEEEEGGGRSKKKTGPSPEGEENKLKASPRKAMQNHLEISSKTQFWIRNVRNLTNNRYLGYRAVGGRSPAVGGGRRAGDKVHGPRLMGPYGPILLTE